MAKCSRNSEGYADSTAGLAIHRVSKEEKNKIKHSAIPDPRRQMIGRRSKASGETFERWLSEACEFYLRNGWAHIEKTPEPFHITGKDKNGVVRGMRKKGSRIIKGSCVTALA